MEQTKVRIIYDAETKRPKRFIIPHSDDHLVHHLPDDGEAHLDIDNNRWGSLQSPCGPNLDVIRAHIKSETE